MNFNPHDIYTPPGGPPQGPPPPEGLYQDIGQDGIYQLLEDFYLVLMDSEISDIFPQGKDAMVDASKKSADFFIGLLGGPPLYHQRHGPPRLRARHLPFPISNHTREVWLDCFKKSIIKAVEEERFPAKSQGDFYDFLESFSTWMVNRES
jgi:hemoglobin